MPRLILTLNNKVLSNYKMGPVEFLTIGRHRENTICIDSELVSARHAAVRIDQNKLVIKDIGSQNGTFVNYDQVRESELFHQDWITIGNYVLIVDQFESLSLEATENELRARSNTANDADHTLFVDRKDLHPGYMNSDYLFFLNSPRKDYDLNHKIVGIGKNKEAQIKIGGLWSFLAGKPTATISKQGGAYFLQYINGMLKPKINGAAIKAPTKLKHQDIIKIGSLEIQFRSIRHSVK